MHLLKNKSYFTHFQAGRPKYVYIFEDIAQLEKIYMETLTELHSFYHRLIQNLFQYKTHPPTFQATEGLIKMYAKYFLKILTASPYAMHLKMVHNIFPFPQQSYDTKLYVMTSFSIVTSFGLQCIQVLFSTALSNFLGTV